MTTAPELQETRAAIIPELVELASDEEVAVRLAAFRTLVDMLDILDAGEAPVKRKINIGWVRCFL